MSMCSVVKEKVVNGTYVFVAKKALVYSKMNVGVFLQTILGSEHFGASSASPFVLSHFTSLKLAEVNDCNLNGFRKCQRENDCL